MILYFFGRFGVTIVVKMVSLAAVKSFAAGKSFLHSSRSSISSSSCVSSLGYASTELIGFLTKFNAKLILLPMRDYIGGNIDLSHGNKMAMMPRRDAWA